MAKKKNKAEPTEIEKLRKENSQLLGFIYRLFGFLHLKGEDRFEACRKWLDRKAKTQISFGGKSKPPESEEDAF